MELKYSIQHTIKIWSQSHSWMTTYCNNTLYTTSIQCEYLKRADSKNSGAIFFFNFKNQ